MYVIPSCQARTAKVPDAHHPCMGVVHSHIINKLKPQCIKAHIGMTNRVYGRYVCMYSVKQQEKQKPNPFRHRCHKGAILVPKGGSSKRYPSLFCMKCHVLWVRYFRKDGRTDSWESACSLMVNKKVSFLGWDVCLCTPVCLYCLEMRRLPFSRSGIFFSSKDSQPVWQEELADW